MTAKATLPEERTWVTHPRIVTVSPACAGRSAMRTNRGSDIGWEACQWRADYAAPRIPQRLGGTDARALRGRTINATRAPERRQGAPRRGPCIPAPFHPPGHAKHPPAGLT